MGSDGLGPHRSTMYRPAPYSDAERCIRIFFSLVRRTNYVVEEVTHDDGVGPSRLLALAAPAHAVLTVSFQDVNAAVTASCADGSACDNGGAVNQVLQINQTVGNFNIVGTFRGFHLRVVAVVQPCHLLHWHGRT